MPSPRRPLSERFWEKVHKTDSCWLWTGTTSTWGYGRIASGGREGSMLMAHRVSWEIAFGSIPDGKHICHHCDNPPCVRPDHLFLGDPKTNARDMVNKGRHYSVDRPHRSPIGIRNAAAKITEDIVREIREAQGPATEVGKRYGLGQSQVLRIRNRQSWKHVK